MSKTFTLDQIKDVLTRGAFDELIGALETELMDFKAEPYHLLSAETDKQEVSKDVASFANARGGVILLGVKTQKSSIHFGDEVESINPFLQTIIDPQRFHDVLQNWIYPVPYHLSIQWLPYSADPTKGLIKIEIPFQPEEAKPFLIKRIIDSGKRTEIMFGFTQRRRDTTEIWSVEKMQNYLRDGLNYGNLISQQYETIKTRLEKLEVLLPAKKQNIDAPKTKNLIQQRILDAHSGTHVSDGDRPVFTLAVIPSQNITIPSLFESNSTDVVKLLESPPAFRSSGFDLDTGSRPKIIKGELRRAAYDGHKSLELWSDGTLIFVARGDQDFLCWGSASRNSGLLIINQLALIESTYLFVELSKKVYDYANTTVSGVVYYLGLHNASKGGHNIGLIPGPIDTFDWKFGDNAHRAPEANGLLTVDADKNLSTGIIAHSIMAKVYNWFSIETDRIPYNEEVDSQLAISPKKIEAVR